MKTRFIHVHSRKLAPACLFLWSRPGSNLMRYSSLSSALRRSSGDFKTAKDRFLSFSSSAVWTKFICEQLQSFTEMKYLASRQNWNFQTWKYRTRKLWVVPSTRFKFRNRDLRYTIPRTPIHRQYSDPWEIERSIFKLEVSWKPPWDNCLGHTRTNRYMAQQHF